MKLLTIGYTKSTAKSFFTRLKNANVKTVIDVRLSNNNLFAGFTKKEDLRFFLNEICNIDYKHMPNLLAPSKDLHKRNQKGTLPWSQYETEFIQLLIDRKIENVLMQRTFDHGCLLCSESTADHCHRRLVAEYLQQKWGNIDIEHL